MVLPTTPPTAFPASLLVSPRSQVEADIYYYTNLKEERIQYPLLSSTFLKSLSLLRGFGRFFFYVWVQYPAEKRCWIYPCARMGMMR